MSIRILPRKHKTLQKGRTRFENQERICRSDTCYADLALLIPNGFQFPHTHARCLGLLISVKCMFYLFLLHFGSKSA